MKVMQLTDPNEEKVLTLCHQLADLSLRPLRDVRDEIRRKAAEVQAILSEKQ